MPRGLQSQGDVILKFRIDQYIKTRELERENTNDKQKSLLSLSSGGLWIITDPV